MFHIQVYESLLYIGELVVSLDEVRCFSVRNVSTSEGYLHSLGVQPQNFFVVANRRSRFTGLVNLSFQMWRQERATRTTIDIFVVALCSSLPDAKMEIHFIVTDDFARAFIHDLTNKINYLVVQFLSTIFQIWKSNFFCTLEREFFSLIIR